MTTVVNWHFVSPSSNVLYREYVNPVRLKQAQETTNPLSSLITCYCSGIQQGDSSFDESNHESVRKIVDAKI